MGVSARWKLRQWRSVQSIIGATENRQAAGTAADTDWAQVVVLYDMLADLVPGPVVTLNRAVAVAEVDGAAAGLALLEPLRADPGLTHQHRLPAVRAHLLERLGRRDEARAEYAVAARLATSIPEQRYLASKVTR